MNKIQVLQNKQMRLVSRSGYDTPRVDLLRKCNQLSVKQLVVYHVLCQTHKIFHSKLPDYHYRKLFRESRNQRVGNRSQSQIVEGDEDILVSNKSATIIDYKKSISRGTFFYQASKLWNSLPTLIRNKEKKQTFKKSVKLWVSQNIRPF